jgi:hypothetical protein
MDTKSINGLMAKFLGWEKETYPNGSEGWFANDDIARELNFHQDWNELMKIVVQIAKLPNPSDQPKKTPFGWVAMDEFRITPHAILIKAYKRVNAESYWDNFMGFNRFTFATDSNMLDTCYSTLSEFIIWYYDDTLVY